MKYIIDVSDEAIELMGGHISIFVEPVFKTGDCKHYALRLSKEDIEPYTEHDRKAIEDEVWWFTEKLSRMKYEEIRDCFGIGYEGEFDVLSCLTYSKAKAKYEAWKKQKDGLRVGDEVVYHRNKYIVGYVGENEVYHLVDQCWIRVVVQGDYKLTKTGRHFPEVTELLKKMRDTE